MSKQSKRSPVESAPAVAPQSAVVVYVLTEKGQALAAKEQSTLRRPDPSKGTGLGKEWRQVGIGGGNMRAASVLALSAIGGSASHGDLARLVKPFCQSATPGSRIKALLSNGYIAIQQ